MAELLSGLAGMAVTKVVKMGKKLVGKKIHADDYSQASTELKYEEFCAHAAKLGATDVDCADRLREATVLIQLIPHQIEREIVKWNPGRVSSLRALLMAAKITKTVISGKDYDRNCQYRAAKISRSAFECLEQDGDRLVFDDLLMHLTRYARYENIDSPLFRNMRHDLKKSLHYRFKQKRINSRLKEHEATGQKGNRVRLARTKAEAVKDWWSGDLGVEECSAE